MMSNARMLLLRNLCVLLVACLVGLFLCEGSLRLFYPKYAPLAEARTRFDTLRIWARIPNDRAEHPHPDTGSVHALHHNNLGLRQHRNFTAADLATAINVGVFGDSFVENVGMDAPYSLTEPLDYLLNQSGGRFNVLNFGVDGYGPGQSLLHYEHFRYADALAHVFYVYCKNDLENIAETGLFHLDEAGRLVQHEAIRTSWWATRMSRLHLPYLILDATGHISSYAKERARGERLKRGQLWDRYKERVGGEKKDEGLKQRFAIFRRLIRRWKQGVERNGGKFYVVLLPQHIPAAAPRISDLLRNEDIATVSLYDCFGAYDVEHYQRSWSGSPYRFMSDGHWNEAGNRLAALCLYRALEEDMRLPALAEETLQAALRRYYAAFEGWRPVNAGEEGDEPPISMSTGAGIRGKYRALDAPSTPVPVTDLADASDKRVIIRSTFTVYLSGRFLIYHKEGCRWADLSPWFFLHITPVDETDIPSYSARYGFVNRDFRVSSFEVGRNTCTVKTRLPDYAIRHIRTGQHISEKGRLWEGEALIDPHPIRQD